MSGSRSCSGILFDKLGPAVANSEHRNHFVCDEVHMSGSQLSTESTNDVR